MDTVSRNEMTVADFESIFGEPASSYLKEVIQSYDLGFNPLAPAEEVKTIEDIHRELDNLASPRAGSHRIDQWESGWGENLDLLRAHAPEALMPKYFKKQSLVRCRGHYAHPTDPNFEYHVQAILQAWLFQKYFPTVDAIYEFGCGTGHNLLRAAKANPRAKLVGLDWATSSQEIIAEIKAQGLAENISGYRFDFFNPDYAIKLPPHSGVYTAGALEQVGNDGYKFIDYLLANRPAICFHIEPIRELFNPTVPIDQISLEYAEKRNYLKDFLPYLQKLEKEGKIVIHDTRRTYCGARYMEGSIIAWSPA